MKFFPANRKPHAEANARIIIIGGPRTGKSTLANTFGFPVMSTDPEHLVKDPLPNVEYVPKSYLDKFPQPEQWSAASRYVADEFLTRKGPWVLEGVGAPRALRKYLLTHTEVPAEQILIVRSRAFVQLKPGQRSMTAGVDTVLNEIMPKIKDVVEEIRIGAK